jgi:hypothetical protein
MNVHVFLGLQVSLETEGAFLFLSSRSGPCSRTRSSSESQQLKREAGNLARAQKRGQWLKGWEIETMRQVFKELDFFPGKKEARGWLNSKSSSEQEAVVKEWSQLQFFPNPLRKLVSPMQQECHWAIKFSAKNLGWELPPSASGHHGGQAQLFFLCDSLRLLLTLILSAFFYHILFYFCGFIRKQVSKGIIG